MDFPFWSDPGTDSWDGLVMAGPLGPMFTGKPTQEGNTKVKVSFAEDIEVKKPNGKDGATTTDRGQKPADVEITLTIATKEQWQNFTANVAPNLRSQAGKRPAAKGLDVVHPACNVWGITSVLIQNVSGPDVDSSGMGTVTIRCIENRPPKAGKGAITTKGTIAPFSNAFAPAGPPAPVKPSSIPVKP